MLVSFHPETSRSIRLPAPNYTAKYSRKIPGLNPDTSFYLTDPSAGKYFMTYIITNVQSLITNILAALKPLKIHKILYYWCLFPTSSTFQLQMPTWIQLPLLSWSTDFWNTVSRYSYMERDWWRSSAVREMPCLAQAGGLWLLTWQIRFNTRPVHVRICCGQSRIGTGFSLITSAFLCQLSFHQYLINNNSWDGQWGH